MRAPHADIGEQVDQIASVATMKRLHRTQRKAIRRTARERRRQRRRHQTRCFWTWPLGHEFVTIGEPSPSGLRLAYCVGCQKQVWR